MRFGPSRDAGMHFHLGTQNVPLVQTYTYLGVALQENLGWKKHADQLLARGESRFAACLVSMPFPDSNFIGTSARLFY